MRLIDLFVDALDLKEMNFDMDFGHNGRPAYYPGVLLKLFLYGYLNRIHSSRTMEKECARNIELMWLKRSLVPDFYYIMTKKTMKRASADIGLVFTAYNLRRIMNLIDHKTLKKFLKELAFVFSHFRSHFEAFCRTIFVQPNPRNIPTQHPQNT
jgi:transposase